jgi:hypothetical protein
LLRKLIFIEICLELRTRGANLVHFDKVQSCKVCSYCTYYIKTGICVDDDCTSPTIAIDVAQQRRHYRVRGLCGAERSMHSR